MKKLLTLTASELTANIKSMNLYPLGFLYGRETGRPHNSLGINKRPVLLVHGMAHNASAFIPLKRRMKSEKWNNVFSINYPTWHGSLTRMVDTLSRRVEDILEETHSEQIDIVGHSLGGIISRYFMSIGPGRGKVNHLVTLGTPHRGTPLSRVLRIGRFGGLNRDLRSGSYMTRLLNETDLPPGSKITSLYSKYDLVVWPGENCKAGGSPAKAFRNVELNHMGHLGLLHNPDSFDEVIKALLSVD